MLRRLSVCSLQISGNSTTKLKSHPWNNEEQLKFGECLLPFSPESFVSHLLSKNKKIKMYRIVNFYIVWYGCETWSLTLREEHWLRGFENRLLKKIFGPTRQDVNEDWRKLHNKGLQEFCYLRDTIQVIRWRKMRWNGHVGRREIHTGFWWGNMKERDYSE